MTKQLGSVWQSSLQIQSLLAMTDVNNRAKFSGYLQHMLMGMGRNNEFVQAKQAGSVLAPYVQDLRKPKKGGSNTPNPPVASSSLTTKQACTKIECLQNVRLKFSRDSGSLWVEQSGKMVAIASKPKSDELLNALPSAIKQKVITNQFIKVTAHVQAKSLLKVEIS